MHKSLITFLLLIAMGVNLKSQITLDIADIESCTSPVTVPIVIQENINLISMQFSVQWDGTELAYIGNTAPIFPSGFAFGGPTGDTLAFSWFDFGGFTLNPGDTIFSLQFNLIGSPGDISPVEFYTGTDPGFPPTEAAEPGFVPVPVTEVNGSVTFGGVNPIFVGCPTNITISNDIGDCQAMATWTEPTVSDCDNNDNPFTSTASPGDVFPVGTTTVTYSVSDADGNMGSCSFDVTVQDTENPTINCAVPSITVNVATGTPSTTVTDANLVPTFGDNCPGSALTYVRTGVTSDSGTGNANGLSYNVGTTTVTYTVTDAAGLMITCAIDVIVVESAAPPITLQILSEDIDCDATTAEVSIVILEDVDLVSLQFSVNWDGTALTYTGNTPPIFPSGFAFGQTGDTLSFSWFNFGGTSLSAGDTIFSLMFNVNGTQGSCYPVDFYAGTNPLIVPVEAAGPGFVPIPVTTVNGEVCIVDLAPPTITCPANVTINCGDDTSTANTGMATATDDCDPAPAITSSDSSTGGCGNTETITRTFTATDASGAMSTCMQTITVVDNIDPTFDSAPAPLANINCGDSFPVQETITASDNCGTATVVPTQSFTEDICNGYTVTYTWTATDQCSNTEVTSVTFDVLPDTQDPTFDSAPAPLANINCGDSFPTQETLTAMDNCSAVNVVPTQSFTEDICNGYTVTYTWTATDACNNSTVVSTSFDVLPDTQDPTFDAGPTALSDINCGDSFPTQETLTAMDNCSAVNVVPTQTFTEDICNGYTVTYTWTATDACNNSTVVSTSFDVLPDTQDPTFASNPAPLPDINCGDSFPVQETLTATDNCSAVNVVPSQSFVEDICNGYLVTYTWIATDACNNSTTVTQSFNVLPDTQGPAFDASPAPLADINCDDTFPAQEMLSATDNCGSAMVTTSQSFVEDLCNGYSVTYTWIAVDDCNNSTTVTQTFNVLPDSEAPTFTAPSDITLTCNQDPNDLLLTGNATGLVDDCGANPMVGFTDDVTGLTGCSGTGIILRSWVSEDDCNNMSVAQVQTITIEDNTAPMVICQDVTLQLDATGNATLIPADLDNGSTDNCSAALSFAASQTSFDCTNVGINIITLTVTDDCNNSMTCQSNVTVVDNIPPTITCPNDTTLMVVGNATSLVVNGLMATASDQCAGFTVAYSSAGATILNGSGDISGSAFNLGTTTVTYTVTDVNGTQATCTFNVTVNGSVTIECPGDTTVDATTGTCTATVNGIPVTILSGNPLVDSIYYELTGATTGSGEPDASGTTFNVGATTVTYTVVDDMANEIVCSFVVTVEDKENPNLTCPNDTIVTTAPGDNNIIVNGIDAIASDLCGTVGISYAFAGVTTGTGSGTASGTSFDVGVTTVTYTATDEGGNAVDCSFTVTVNFGGSLLLIDCPSDTTLGTAIDACGETVTDIAPLLLIPTGNVAELTYEISGSTTATGTDDASGTFFNTGTSIVKYNITSTMGIMDSCSFMVTVIDDDDPTATCVPLDAFTADAGACSRLVNNNLLPATDDNCGVDQITYEITGATTASGTGNASGTTFNVGLSILTYTITDAAGNSTTCFSEVQVNDNESPSGFVCPSDTFILVNQGVTQVTVNDLDISGFTDNCGIDSVAYILTNATTGNGENDASGNIFNLGSTTVTYEVHDIHGNIGTCSFVVTIGDSQNGIMCPAAVNINSEQDNCGATIADLTPIILLDSMFIDSIGYAISGATTASGLGNASGSFFNAGTSTLTYYLYSNGMLSDSCSTSIEINDTQNPVWSNCPGPIVLAADANCMAMATWTPPTASDNCNVDQINTPTFAPGDNFPLGITTLTYTAIDASGNMAECTFTVTVEDNGAPSIEQLPDITVSVNAGTCTGNANWNDPVTTDDCSGILTLDADFNTSDNFPIGNTDVTYTAVDTEGNIATMEFTITVVDDELPVITNCPPADLVITPVGNCQVMATWTAPTATDNCGISSFTSTLNSGDIVSQNTTVVYFATDESGNVAQCQFEISIMDQMDPTWITVPDNVTVSTDPGTCQAAYTWPDPVAMDDCGAVSITSTHPNGSNFSTGPATTVTLTGIDNGGNTITHDFTVTVEDGEMPVAVCPEAITLREDGQIIADGSGVINTITATNNCGGLIINLNPLTATDNCDASITGTQTSGPDFTQALSAGNYMAEFSFTDAAGNSVTCPLNISIISLPAIDLSAEPDSAGCTGENIQIGPSDLIPGATISWTGPDNFSSSLIAPTIEMSAATAGVYTASFTTANGCVSSSQIELFLNEVPSITASSNSPICNGLVELMGESSSGPAITSWEWTGPCSFSDSGQNVTITDLDPACSGTYTLTASTAEGCSTTISTEVESSTIPLPSLSNDCGSAICLGESCMLIGTEFIQGSVNYIWTAPTGVGLPANTNSNEVLITPTEVGSFEISYVVEVDGCVSDIVTQTIEVLGGPNGEDDFYVIPYETVYQGSTILENDQVFSEFTLELVNLPDFGTVELNDDGTFIYTPFNGFIGIDGFEYELCQDCGENECERVSVILRVEFDGDCVVPTFLSPNNDGKNDILNILCLDDGSYPDNTLKISNRWGDVVFEAAPYQNNWDGTLNGSNGKELPDGTYFFLFQQDLDTPPVKGFITILR